MQGSHPWLNVGILSIRLISVSECEVTHFSGPLNAEAPFFHKTLHPFLTIMREKGHVFTRGEMKAAFAVALQS